MKNLRSTDLLIWIVAFAMITINCKEEKVQTKSQYPTTTAFKEYQSKRLKEFEGNITNPGGIPALGENDVFALVMDWNLGQGRYATLSVLRDGRTKIFTSSGAKDIDIKHQNVFNEVNRFLQYASTQVVNSGPFKNTRLPEEGHFVFYFKSNNGVSMATGFVDDIPNGQSPWGPLFNQANAVIREVRATYQDFGNNPE